MALTDLEFFAVVPKEATNMVTNPSIEIDTTGYTASGAGVSIARDTGEQRHGIASCRVNPASGVVSGVYYTTVTLGNGLQYSFSADILDINGQTFNLFIADNAGSILSSNVTWTGTGHWKRRTVTYTAASSAVHRLYVTRSVTAATSAFYVDGFQLEIGAASTYFDGDMKGFVRTRNDFYWTGTPHASTSYRSGQTKAGGTEVRLKNYMTIMTVLGLGLAPIINNSLPNVRGGSFFQSSAFDGRTISLSGKVIGLTHGAIQDNRKALIAAINPNLTESSQPMVLNIRGLDAAGGVEQGEPVTAVMQYSGGLEGSWSTPGIEEVALQFQMFLPYLASDGERGRVVTINQSVTNANYLIKRDLTGLWSIVSPSLNGAVYQVKIGPDGYAYVAGNFTNVGDANGDYIIKVSPTGTISSLGTGTNGAVIDIAFGPDGILYAGGSFALAGGVANTVNIAKWNGSAWSALSTGVSAGAGVTSIAIGLDGTVYAGGSFTAMAGVANTAYIAKWNGSTWSAMGTGMNGIVNALAVGRDGTIFAGGTFTLAGGVADTRCVAKWNGSVWSPLATGTLGGGGGAVSGLEVGIDGTLYVGGGFTAMSGVANTAYIAKWNGLVWSAMGTGMNAGVNGLAPGENGTIIASGDFSVAGGVPVPSYIAFWNGSSWTALDVVLPGTPTIYAPRIGNDVLYVGYSTAGTATAPVVTAVTNNGSAPAAPKIKFTGPGTIYQVKNATTGKAIYFNLILLAGETAVLDLNPDSPSFVSNIRGNLMNTILAGSNMDFTLLPGSNNLNIFVAGSTTGATSITVFYTEQFASLDGTRY